MINTQSEQQKGARAATEESLLARQKRDWELMARVAVGDSEAFGEIWHHYREELSAYLFAKNITDPYHRADILLEISLKIQHFTHKYDRQITTISTWFALIANNVTYQQELRYRKSATSG